MEHIRLVTNLSHAFRSSLGKSMLAVLALLTLAANSHAAVSNVAYWRFGENDSGAVNGGSASTTTNLNGGLMNLRTAVTYTNDIAAKASLNIGSSLALRFNSGNYGTNALVSTLTNNFGIELWVKPNTNNVTQCLAYNGNSGVNGWGLYLLSSGQFVGLYGGAGFVGSATVTNGVWTHLALVRDNGTTTLYLNGIPSGTSAINPNLPSGIFAVATQPQGVGAELFSGLLDEVRVFSFVPGGFNTNDLLSIDAPPSATNLSVPETYTEDTTLNLTDIVVSDSDSTVVVATLTLSDINAGTLSTGTSGTTTSTFVGGVWTASGAIAEVNTLLAGVTFTPALNYNSSFTIATSVGDGILTVNASKAMSGTPLNDAPTASNLSAGQTYTEDTSLALTAIIASDIDSANVTATLTLSTASAGTLNTGTSGAVTSTYSAGVWTASGPIANVNALLAGITFTPALNFNSNFTIATSVSDGALSVTGSKAMTGIAVNDAPVLDATKSPAITTVLEDAPAPSGAVGSLVSSLLDFAVPSGQVDNVTDVDAGAATGIAITAVDPSLTCYFSLNGGVTWTAFGAVSTATSRLLAADADNRIYVQPAANYNGTSASALTFRAWDLTTGTDGGTADTTSNGGSTAFSTATDTIAQTVTSVNDAPTASNLSAAQTYTEDTPLAHTAIVVSDVDSPNVTATLTLSTTSAGSLSTGTSGLVTSTFSAGVWTASGAIGDVNALLAGVTFIPAANFNGNFTIATSVSDGSLSVTGSKAMTGTPVNDGPVLDTTKSPAMATLLEDASAPSGAVGTLVSSLVDFASPAGQVDNVTDVDTGAATGIAITAVDANFTGYYSINGGTTWTALGVVSTASSRLLAADADNRIYLQPVANYNGTTASALTFRAWDQTTGTDGATADTTSNGGTTAFSTATDTISQTVTAVNDAPTASNLSAAETYIEDTSLNLIDIVATDIDSTTVTATLTLSDVSAGSLSTGTSGAVTSTYVAGTGVWTASGLIANVNALLAGVTFTPASHYTNNFTIATSVSDGALSVTGSKAMTAFPASGFIVTTNSNSGPGSLRDVIAAVPTNSTITFATNLSGQTITLTSEIVLNKNLTFTATNLPSNIVISGGGTTRIFYINIGLNITMNNLTLTGGNGVGALLIGRGGAIYQSPGSLTMSRCTLTGNSAANLGGAIAGFGGNLSQCTLSDNLAGSDGGAIEGTGGAGTFNLTQCTISGNSAGSSGGAMHSISGTGINLTQTTVTGNKANVVGGGFKIDVLFSPTLIANSSIVAGNTAPSGADIDSGGATGANNFIGGNPLLAPLGNYGGPTQTRPPLSGSPVVDAGLDSITNSFTTDQRGFPRLVGTHVDIGAVEGALDAAAPVVTTLAATGVGLNSGTLNATVNPRNLATLAWLEWGTTTNYGNFSATNQLAAINTPSALSLPLTGLTPYTTYHYRAVATNVLGRTAGSDVAFTPTTIAGDQNGDGIVTEAEINAAFANYLATSPWLSMTNVAGLGGTNVTFTLGSAPSGITFTVEYSTDLVNWQPLGPATPRYLFTDTNAPAIPQRSYRLRYP